MAKQLTNQDRIVVDMLLDQHVTSHDGSHPTATTATSTFRKRIKAAEKVLSVLDIWQPADPPTDLIQQTLRRVQDAQANHPKPVQTHQPDTQHVRPVI
ncbi:MAG: hypothetical protein IT447_10950 [Phycisphaerales bacterium]|jgi:hypothetical protein|nr:hypothetical protein [Phycisphaerales bacterium]